MRRAMWAIVFGALVTGLTLASPYLTVGVYSPSGHLLLNALDAFIGLLAAALLHGRFLRQRRLQDLLLAQGLVLLVVAGLGLGYVSHVVEEIRPGTLDVWLPLSLRLVGACLIVAAALSRTSFVVKGGWSQWPVLLSLAVVAGLSVALWVGRSALPAAFDVAEYAAAAQPRILPGHPVLLTVQAFSGVCFFVAAAAFTRQAMRQHDELISWLGPACVLAAFARINYVLFPSLYTDWLYTGDLLRTGFYVLLLTGAAREIQQYWASQADIAVLEDRQRLARELHDGVIQELSYIKVESHALTAETPRDHILGACDRALDEARAAVHALGSPGDEPLSAMIERAARQLADRYDVELELDLDDTVFVTPDQRHALVRIMREACTNAVSHGKAQHVSVQLDVGADGGRLRVEDDGRGFDVEDVLSGAHAKQDGRGYGLVSMRERARGLPGVLAIESEPSSGSVVTVTW
jgi:signal transduction histidine kinase